MLSCRVLEEKLEGESADIQKAAIHKGYLIVLSRQSGVKVYSIRKGNKLVLVQIIKHQR